MALNSRSNGTGKQPIRTIGPADVPESVTPVNTGQPIATRHAIIAATITHVKSDAAKCIRTRRTWARRHGLSGSVQLTINLLTRDYTVVIASRHRLPLFRFDLEVLQSDGVDGWVAPHSCTRVQAYKVNPAWRGQKRECSESPDTLRPIHRRAAVCAPCPASFRTSQRMFVQRHVLRPPVPPMQRI